MRKFLLLALLAGTAASPAFAQRWDHENHDGQRGARSEQTRPANEGPRGGGEGRGNFGRFGGQQPQLPPQAAPQAQMQMQQRFEPGNAFGSEQRVQREQMQMQMQQRFQRDPMQMQDRRNFERPQNVDPAQRAQSWGDRQRFVGQRGTGIFGHVVEGATNPNPNWQDRNRDYRGDGDRWRDHTRYSGGQIDGRWRQDWRQDRRYDWRSYRDRNRSVFRIGVYYDPFGYGYQRFGIGSWLYPGYYQQNFWLNDPWQYRLPMVDGPYRWVRYYDDALLVDIYSGQVVDVIHDFFW